MKKNFSNGIAGTEPIPGYILRQRLGAGGYGEVWLADAPGGLSKAIKIIHGQVDESRANSELRSLERIRQAFHPFLLSIERIEIVDGKVFIVTELAETSLQERFQQYQRQGVPGIPRSELLEFLRDAADALDFLAQKHSLQHLDVKPGNLLVVADRVKVADFGLLKDLKEAKQSVVGGLTPAYSAPELFDGCPSYRSDQYSLAIVFMEMLTGKLPFKGMSAGEIARQHLAVKPNLEPLPPADRKIVARALAKNPMDRYASCRQFIDELLKSRRTSLPPLNELENSEYGNPGSNASTMMLESLPLTDLSATNFFHCSIPLRDLASQWVQSRCLFIGLGGQGSRALKELQIALESNKDNRFQWDDHQWLKIDTEPEEGKQTSPKSKSADPLDGCFYHLPIHSPQHYRQYPIEKFAGLSRRWLYNIPRSLKTEGVRPIATLGLIENYESLSKVIQQKLEILAQQHLQERQGDSPLKIYLLASLHGGTGSALLAEIGLIIRRLLRQMSFDDYRVSAAVSAATADVASVAPNLLIANALATLSELSYWMDPNQQKTSIGQSSGSAISEPRPFDWVTLIDGGTLNDSSSHRDSSKKLAEFVSIDCQSLLSAALRTSRLNASDVSEHGWLRNSVIMPLKKQHDFTFDSSADWCCVHAIKSTIAYLNEISLNSMSSNPTESGQRSYEHRYISFTKGAYRALKAQFSKNIGVNLFADSEEPNKEWIHQWSCRLSSDNFIRNQQWQTDLSIWKHILDDIISQRVVGWTSVMPIQQIFHDALAEFKLKQNLDWFLRLPKDSLIELSLDELRKRVNEYIADLISANDHIFASISSEAGVLNRQYRDYWAGIMNDTKLIQHAKTSLSQLPESIRRTLSGTQSQLESIAVQSLCDVLRSEICYLSAIEQPTSKHQVASLTEPRPANFASISRLAKEIMVLIQNESDRSPSECGLTDDSRQSMSTESLMDFRPTFCLGGGEIFRIVIAPEQQMKEVCEAIESLGLIAETTLLPGGAHQEAMAICDVVHVNLPFLVTALWRPSGATLDLAERIRTRTDIDWEPVSRLLESHRTHPTFESESSDDLADKRPKAITPACIAVPANPNSSPLPS
jgi:serine/threonine protein kinase